MDSSGSVAAAVGPTKRCIRTVKNSYEQLAEMKTKTHVSFFPSFLSLPSLPCIRIPTCNSTFQSTFFVFDSVPRTVN